MLFMAKNKGNKIASKEASRKKMRVSVKSEVKIEEELKIVSIEKIEGQQEVFKTPNEPQILKKE